MSQPAEPAALETPPGVAAPRRFCNGTMTEPYRPPAWPLARAGAGQRRPRPPVPTVTRSDAMSPSALSVPAAPQPPARSRVAPSFAERAMRAIVRHLEKHPGGTASGEALVRMLKRRGIGPTSGDDRAYGVVFAPVRHDPNCPIYVIRADLPRERGHGTSGGKLYGLTRQRERH